MERTIPDARHARRDLYALEAGAALKRVIPDAPQLASCSECHAIELAAGIERTLPDARHAVRDRHALEVGARYERIVPDARRVITDVYIGNTGSLTVPRWSNTSTIIIHRAGAEDGQGAVLKLPKQIVAAFLCEARDEVAVSRNGERVACIRADNTAAFRPVDEAVAAIGCGCHGDTASGFKCHRTSCIRVSTRGNDSAARGDITRSAYTIPRNSCTDITDIFQL